VAVAVADVDGVAAAVDDESIAEDTASSDEGPWASSPAYFSATNASEIFAPPPKYIIVSPMDAALYISINRDT
jgi:hypothetical protein